MLPRGVFVVSIRTQACSLSYLSPPPPRVSPSSPNPFENTQEEAPSFLFLLNRLFYFGRILLNDFPHGQIGTAVACHEGREVIRLGPYPPNSRLRGDRKERPLPRLLFLGGWRAKKSPGKQGPK